MTGVVLNYNSLCVMEDTFEVDKKVAKAQDMLLLTEKDVKSLHKIFMKYDPAHKGTINVGEFFSKQIRMNRSIVTDSIFMIAGARDPCKLSFGDFMLGICSFLMFQVDDFIRLIFFIYDEKKQGYIRKEHLESFIRIMHNGLRGNARAAYANIDFNIDGKFEYEELVSFTTSHPYILFPIVTLQQKLKMNTLGERRWTKILEFIRGLNNDEKLELKKNSMQQEALQQWLEKTKKQLGPKLFLQNGAERRFLERRWPKPEAYVDDEKNVRICYSDPIILPGDSEFEYLLVSKERQTKYDWCTIA